MKIVCQRDQRNHRHNDAIRWRRSENLPLMPLRRCSSSSAVPTRTLRKRNERDDQRQKEKALGKNAEAAPHQATNKPANDGPTRREP